MCSSDLNLPVSKKCHSIDLCLTLYRGRLNLSYISRDLPASQKFSAKIAGRHDVMIHASLRTRAFRFLASPRCYCSAAQDCPLVQDPSNNLANSAEWRPENQKSATSAPSPPKKPNGLNSAKSNGPTKQAKTASGRPLRARHAPKAVSTPSLSRPSCVTQVDRQAR